MQWEKDDSRAYQKWLRDHSGYEKKHGTPHREPEIPKVKKVRPLSRQPKKKTNRKAYSRQMELIHEPEDMQVLEKRRIHNNLCLYREIKDGIKRFNKSDCATLIPDNCGVYGLNCFRIDPDTLDRDEFVRIFSKAAEYTLDQLDGEDIKIGSVAFLRSFGNMVTFEKVDTHIYKCTYCRKTRLKLPPFDPKQQDMKMYIEVGDHNIQRIDWYKYSDGQLEEIEPVEGGNDTGNIQQ